MVFFFFFFALLITLLAWFTGCYCIFWGVWYHRRVHEYGYVVGTAGWLRTDGVYLWAGVVDLKEGSAKGNGVS